MGKFQSPLPYPPVQVCGRNPAYAREMLSNIGSCHSEMSTVSLYIFNSLVTEDEFEEISQCFQGMSVVEMHHLRIFSKLAMRLGAQPRLWSQNRGQHVYWSPACNKYPCQLKAILINAIEGENAAIEKYRKQITYMNDPYICALLERIILDEELHVEILTDLFKRFIQRRD